MRNSLSLWRNRSPFADLFDAQRGWDKFFNEMDFPRTTGTLGKDWNPQCAVTEDERAYHVKVDLPGVEKENIKVDYNDGVLTLSGERRNEKKTDSEKEHYSEVFYGNFMRTFSFPTAVDAEKVSAKFENGVLNVDLEKTSRSQARQVTVR